MPEVSIPTSPIILIFLLCCRRWTHPTRRLGRIYSIIASNVHWHRACLVIISSPPPPSPEFNRLKTQENLTLDASIQTEIRSKTDPQGGRIWFANTLQEEVASPKGWYSPNKLAPAALWHTISESASSLTTAQVWAFCIGLHDLRTGVSTSTSCVFYSCRVKQKKTLITTFCLLTADRESTLRHISIHVSPEKKEPACVWGLFTLIRSMNPPRSK